MKSIEEFKKQIIETKEHNGILSISKVDSELYESISEEQKPYGKEYEPKERRSLFGTKEICPNCSMELNNKYLGKKWNKMFREYWHYYIKSCDCGYKYAEIECGSRQ